LIEWPHQAADHVVFEFEDEDLRIEMRVNCSLGLARVLGAGPSAIRKGKTK
jgi:hypothetical protein